MKSADKRTGLFVFILLLGAILGNAVGEILGNYVPALQFFNRVYSIGLNKPLFLDLKVLNITFGMNFTINIMSIIGIILAIILYRKY